MSATDALSLDDLDLPTFTHVSVARVATDRPARYGHQLVSHMSRRMTGAWDEDAQCGFLSFDRDGASGGSLEVTCEAVGAGGGPGGAGAGEVSVGDARAVEPADGSLVLTLRSSQEGVERLEQVVGIHLARFGFKDGLVVAWQRLVPGTEGASATGEGPGIGRVPGSQQGPLSAEDMERMHREHGARQAAQAER